MKFSLRKQVRHCEVEQLVARWAHNPKVVSSSLTLATRSKLIVANDQRAGLVPARRY